jgi:CheY-like chemotaxis protein
VENDRLGGEFRPGALMAHAVLVVDDSPDDIEITRCLLEAIDPDLRFVSAASGAEALEALRSGANLPGLIFVDLKMPGMEGTDMVRQLRCDERLRSIPAILVSHSRLEADRARSLAAGADEFLHKDFDLDRLTSTLRGVLDRWLRH